MIHYFVIYIFTQWVVRLVVILIIDRLKSVILNVGAWSWTKKNRWTSKFSVTIYANVYKLFSFVLKCTYTLLFEKIVPF